MLTIRILNIAKIGIYNRNIFIFFYTLSLIKSLSNRVKINLSKLSGDSSNKGNNFKSKFWDKINNGNKKCISNYEIKWYERSAISRETNGFNKKQGSWSTICFAPTPPTIRTMHNFYTRSIQKSNNQRRSIHFEGINFYDSFSTWFITKLSNFKNLNQGMSKSKILFNLNIPKIKKHSFIKANKAHSDHSDIDISHEVN